MNRKIVIVLIALLILVIFTLSACLPFSFVNNDSETAEKLFQLFIEAIDSGNKEKIKSLFAVNAIENIDNFDNALNLLVSFYNGDLIEHVRKSFATFSNKNDGYNQKYYNMYYTCETEVDMYDIVLLWYTQDTKDSSNLGIWSLYIVKSSEATDDFWYDWEDGINIVYSNDDSFSIHQ